MEPQQAIKTHLGHLYTSFVTIGQGSFATVFKARSGKTSELVAIKQINKEAQDPSTLEYLQTEIEIMRMSRNDNIVRFIDCLPINEYIYIVMEYCSTDLDHIWKDHFDCHMPQNIVLSIMKQLLNAFAFLHEHDIIHRDIKLENVLVVMTPEQLNQLRKRNIEVVHNMKFKLADMGLAKKLGHKDDLTQTYTGSPLTMAPEIHEGREYGIGADMYSLGIVVYQLLFGDFPYYTNEYEQEEQHEVIRRGDANFNLNGIKIPQDFENLIRDMIEYDPQKRLQWEELYRHPYFYVAPLQRMNTQDLQIRKNSTVYRNKSKMRNELIQKFPLLKPTVDQPRTNPDEQFQDQTQQQQQPLPYVQTPVQPQQQQPIIPEEDEEVIDMTDPRKIFMQRLTHLRNRYILINRASSQMQRIADEQSLQLNSAFLYSVSKQLHAKLQTQLANKVNILDINSASWSDLIQEEDFKSLQLVVQEDASLFQQQQATSQETKGIFAFFLRYFVSSKDESSNTPNIDAATFPAQYAEQLKSLLEQLKKHKRVDSVKLGLISLLQIWQWRRPYSMEDDVHQQDLELQQASQLDSILSRLLVQHNMVI